MRSSIPVKTAKIGCIIMSILLMGMGVYLALNPEIGVPTIGIAAGILSIAFGIFKIVGYFSRDLFRLAFEYDLAFGILLVVLGIIILTRPEHVMSFLCVVIGISVVTDSLLKVQVAVNARPFGIRRWWLIFIAAVLSGILGVLMILHPMDGAQALAVLFGVSLFIEGLMNLITMMLAVKVTKNMRKDDPSDGRSPYSKGAYTDLD